MLHPLIQRLSNPHQQPIEEKQAHEGNTHHDSEHYPILLDRVGTLYICDLGGEVAGHETDGQEQNTELCEQGCGARQAGSGFGVFLGVDVEVLRIELAKDYLVFLIAVDLPWRSRPPFQPETLEFRSGSITGGDRQGVQIVGLQIVLE